MLKYIHLLLVIAIAMSGCAGNHIEPVKVSDKTTSATANLTFPLISDNWEAGTARLAEKTTKNCGVFSADIFPASGDQDFSGTIEGNTDVFFHLTRSDSHRKCDVVGMFYVSNGHEYILNVDIKDPNCKVSLLETRPNGTQRKINTYPAHISTVDNIRVCENKDKLYN